MNDLLAGLLSPAEEQTLRANKKADANRPAFTPKRIRLPAARWITSHLEIILKTQTCAHCGSTHTDPNSLILAVERSACGTKVRKSSTLPQATLEDLNLDELPVRTSTIAFADLPFCTLCIDTLNHQLLTHQFLLQQTKEGIADFKALPSSVPEPLDTDGPSTETISLEDI